jgi:hypothetical protein
VVVAEESEHKAPISGSFHISACLSVNVTMQV